MFRAHSPRALCRDSIPGLHPAAGWEAGRIRVAADREADSRIDKQHVDDPRVGDELPALAFCLLFRFQGAVARGTSQ
jgi:hypothetical protein